MVNYRKVVLVKGMVESMIVRVVFDLVPYELHCR